jgi:4-hydroxy-4-methyl-2-oxoglutarate aldolase
MAVREGIQSGAVSCGSATLHEAIGRRGALPARIKPVDPGWRMAGRAFPVSSPAGDNLWLHRAIYAAGAGEILVVSIDGEGDFGYWGEVMSEAAMARSLGGLVIDGPVRDAARLRALGFPVFAAGLCIRGTEKDPSRHGTLGTSVAFGDVTVSHGDLVVGDEDGVVVVAAADAGPAIELAEIRDQKEAAIFARLRAGETTLSIYGLPS